MSNEKVMNLKYTNKGGSKKVRLLHPRSGNPAIPARNDEAFRHFQDVAKFKLI